MLKTSLYIALVVSILSAYVYFADAPEKILGTTAAINSEQEDIAPYAVARDTSTRHYTADGLLNYEFKASRLEHFRETVLVSKNVFTVASEPRLVFFQQDEPWHIQAKSGRISEKGQQILLWDGVQVKHVSEDGAVTLMETEELVIQPNKKLVNTEEAVKITSPFGVMEAVGMSGDLNTQKIQLLSKVRGHHDPL